MDFLFLSICLLLFVYLLHKYISLDYDYWAKRNIFFLKPAPFFGNFFDVLTFKKHSSEYFRKIYKSSTESYIGIFIFGTPYLVVRDPEVVKDILIKNFDHFVDRTMEVSEHDVLVNSMLFLSKSQDWKNIRAKTSTIFTSSKIKNMFHLINEVAIEMTNFVEANYDNQPLVAKEVSSKFSVDVIAKCAFAIDAHSFQLESNEFLKNSQLMGQTEYSQMIQMNLGFFAPKIAKLLRVNILHPKAVRYMRDVFWKSVLLREKSNTKGNDLIDVIVELRKNKTLCDEDDFVGDRVIAPAVEFLFAGLETTSSTLAFVLHELCINQDVQNKLRAEIKSKLDQYGSFTYENIKELKYLQMVISETLRKYPALGMLDRKCSMDYQLPGTSVTVPKGMTIFVPVYGFHYDPEYYPDPEKFIPERFSEENIALRPSIVYLPFGNGPRICVGNRFAMLTLKLGLINILLKFEVLPSRNTKHPLAIETRKLIVEAESGCPLTLKRIVSHVL